jgi:rhodanese-related sulfurtransferase
MFRQYTRWVRYRFWNKSHARRPHDQSSPGFYLCVPANVVFAEHRGISMLTQDPRQARDYFAQKLAYLTGPFELSGQIKRNEPITIVDVRLPSDFQAGHIPGAINLPQGKWHTLAGVSKDKTAVVYCYSQTCKLAAAAAVELASAGIPVVEMEGGFEAWEKNALPVER